ncbi:MAG: hypothetical protein Q9227_002850 [Pyrenula ochraceoflavens]
MSGIKRSWDCEDDSMSLGEDRFEKRTSRQTTRPYPPPTLTPVDSSEDDDDGVSEDFESIVPDTPAEAPSTSMTSGDQPTIHVSIEDQDMDMDDSEPSWEDTPKPPSYSNSMLAPIRPPPQSSDNTGRIPTPIYGHFNTNTLPHRPTTSYPSNPSLLPAAIPREPDWTRRGRLPSPVYDEDEPMSPAMGEAMDTLKLSTPTTPMHPLSNRGQDTLFDRPRRRSRTGAISAGGDGSSSSRTSRLFVGFKADCEKCQMRVPGHYSHIIRE